MIGMAQEAIALLRQLATDIREIRRQLEARAHERI